MIANTGRVLGKRRPALLSVLVATALLGACGGSPAVVPESQSPPPPQQQTIPPLPRIAPYAAGPNEPLPEVKKPAADLVQALTTYGSSPSPGLEVTQALATLGAPAEIAAKAQPLIVANSQSTGEIVYPELGGYANGEAAVMVVARQRLQSQQGEVTSVVRTVDVRLRMEGAVWKAINVESLGGDPVARPADLDPLQVAVLDNPSIELSDSARWDIYRNLVDRRVLDCLIRLAGDYRVSVSVFSGGHPLNVFATDRLSNHIRGRAVDIWALNGVPIADQRNDALRALVQRLLNEGVTELGSPFDLDGRATRSFTDTVHQDHLHIGYQA